MDRRAERLAKARTYASEADYLKEGRNRTGRYTADESGAYALAWKRAGDRNNIQVRRAAADQKSFEKYIEGGEKY